MKDKLLTKFIDDVKSQCELKYKGSIEGGDRWMKEHPENAPHIRILDDGIQIIY